MNGLIFSEELPKLLIMVEVGIKEHSSEKEVGFNKKRTSFVSSHMVKLYCFIKSLSLESVVN